MPNNCLSVLYKRIIQVENKNVGLKVRGHKHTIAPPIKKVGGHMPPLPPPPPPPPRFLRQCVYIYIYIYIYINAVSYLQIATLEVVHCSILENEHWMFDPRLADVVNSHIFPFGGTGDFIQTNIDCMCWAGNNVRAMIFLTNLWMMYFDKQSG